MGRRNKRKSSSLGNNSDSVTSPRDKKSKKKKLKTNLSHSDTDDFNTFPKNHTGSQKEVEPLSSKKRKDTYTNNDIEDDTDVCKENEDEKILGKDNVAIEWSKEEDRMLLSLVLEDLDSIKSKHKRRPKIRSYRNDIDSINFEEISGKFENQSSNSLKSRVLTLLKEIRKEKSLTQLITEAVEECESRKEKKRKNGFVIFIRQNLAAVKKKNETFGSKNILATASSMWNELSEDNKTKYKSGNSVINTSNSTKQPASFFDVAISPCDAYMKFKLKKNPNSKLSAKEFKLKLDELPMEIRVKWIRKSVKSLELEENKISQYDIDHPGHQEILTSSIAKFPSAEELKIFLSELDAPVYEIMSIYIFFLETRKPIPLSKEDKMFPKLIYATKQFKKIGEREQEKYQLQYSQVVSEYGTKLSEWKSNQSTVVCKLFDQTYPKCQKLVNKMRIKKMTKKSRFSQLKYKEVGMPNEPIYLPKEPLIPPLTPFELYCEKISSTKTAGLHHDTKVLKQLFAALSKENVSKIKKVAFNIQEDYEITLLKYVKSLTLQEKRLYLGLNRKKLVMILHRDIFEFLYPNKDFPLFRKEKNIAAIAYSNELNFLNDSLAKIEEDAASMASSIVKKKPFSSNNLSTSRTMENVEEISGDDENEVGIGIDDDEQEGEIASDDEEQISSDDKDEISSDDDENEEQISSDDKDEISSDDDENEEEISSDDIGNNADVKEEEISIYSDSD